MKSKPLLIRFKDAWEMGKRKRQDVQTRPEICRVEISPGLTPPVAGAYLLTHALVFCFCADHTF